MYQYLKKKILYFTADIPTEFYLQVCDNLYFQSHHILQKVPKENNNSPISKANEVTGFTSTQYRQN